MKTLSNPVIDPYFDTDRCVDRLYKDWVSHNGLIIAFDFDNTIYDYYGNGYAYDKVIKLLKDCKEHGCTLILFTCCDESKYDHMIQYCRSVGIEPDFVNDNPEYIPFCGRKCYYNIMLDDRCGLQQAYEILLKTYERVVENT